MPAYIDQPIETCLNRIHIENLPADTTAIEIRTYFEPFGSIIDCYLRRRSTKHSPVVLSNPTVILTFETRDSIDQIMANRPFSIHEHSLFVHRCLPITRRHPYEAFYTVKKLLIRPADEESMMKLPDDQSIIDHLKTFGGHIVRFEKLETTTILVEFDDYDSVDLCCLSRPHFVNDQLIEIEKCYSEDQSRRQALARQKFRSSSLKLSPNISTLDVDRQSRETISPTLNLSLQQHLNQLRLTYSNLTNRLEDEQKKRLTQLTADWERLTQERIRFQRLTLDYQDESRRLQEENEKLKNLYQEV